MPGWKGPPPPWGGTTVTDVDVSIGDLEGAEAPVVLARLRAEDPASWVDALSGWLVTGYHLAVEVMRDAGSFTVDDPRFSSSQVVGASMLSLDGPEHHRHRAPFVGPFRPGRVESRFGYEIEDLATGLVERIRPDGAADLRTALAGPLSVAVSARALGLRAVDATTVLGWYGAIVQAVSTITAGGTAGPAAGVAVAHLGAHVRAGMSDDVSSVLAMAAAQLTDAEVVSNAAVAMFGGIETTEGMIANLLVHVLRHDEVRAAVTADSSLIPAVVEESLRLEPAAAVVDRYATRNVRLGDNIIGRGDLVRVSLTGANRDPAVFSDPDVFDLRRPNVRSQLSFGRGPHVCVAMDLARLEARIALRTLLDRLPDVRLEGRAAATGLVFRKPAAIPVVWGTKA
jgi:cytochrome P450